MSSKLERLAFAVKRTTPHMPETDDPDVYINYAAKVEREERLRGNFPFDDESVLGVKDFYAGKDIFITGGSGFVGKVLIEKILRSLPEAGKVFLLLRGRKGLSPQQRIQAMLEVPLFKLLMTENPQAAARLVAVDGDIASLGLGLSPADRRILIDNVSIVFHCAATVRFDLNANHMVLVNTRGTREVVSLCKELKKLKSFVYVSTAYTNLKIGEFDPIPEKVLRQKIDWRTIIATAEKSEQNPAERHVLDVLFEKLGTGHYQNYTLTKALAEDVINEEARGLPVIIVRPPVVIPSYEDPIQGWVDNLYGPMGLWVGICQGVVRTHFSDEDNTLQYQPVDLSVKNLILAAWHRGIGFRTSSDPVEVDVLNNGVADIDTSSFKQTHDIMQILFDKAGMPFILRYPRIHITDYFWVFWFLTITAHLPMGILVDGALRLSGKKPMLMNIYRRLYMAQTVLLRPFCSHPYSVDQQWQYRIRARMWRQEDRDRFDVVFKSFKMSYCVNSVEGTIKYSLNKPSVPREKSNRQIMYYLDWLHNALLAYVGWRFLSWVIGKLTAVLYPINSNFTDY